MLTSNFGWLKDLTDFRDYHPGTQSIKNILAKAEAKKSQSINPQAPIAISTVPSKLPVSYVDLRQWCSPIEDQGNLGSCCANAAAGLVEYYQKKAYGKYFQASRLFIYKSTRDLLGLKGDSGAYLRSTMGALALFGVPDEKYWPYIVSKYDTEPAAFLYSLGSNFKVSQYYRLDPVGTQATQIITNIKSQVSLKIPVMFGFCVYSSCPMTAGTGDIPYPSPKDSLLGGHAVDIFGYDDNHVIGTTKGAFLIRNSWSSGWGSSGWGWLPYQYVICGLASDFWCLISESFIDTSLFV